MSLFGGASDGGAAKAEAARQSRIKGGLAQLDQDFSGFDDNFFKQRQKDFLTYQTPQLLQQYQNNRNNLTYALARGGLLNSSSAVNRNSSLGKELALQEGNISNQAEDQANQLRQNVAGQKGALVQQLESSADPQAVQSQAQAVTSSLRAPSALQPIGNLFGDWANIYLTGKANSAWNNAAGGNNNIWSQLQNANYGQPNPSSYIV